MPELQPTLPLWNTTQVNNTEPPSGKKDLGWVFGEEPSSAYDNWLKNQTALYLQWINDRMQDESADDEQWAIFANVTKVAIVQTEQILLSNDVKFGYNGGNTYSKFDISADEFWWEIDGGASERQLTLGKTGNLHLSNLGAAAAGDSGSPRLKIIDARTTGAGIGAKWEAVALNGASVGSLSIVGSDRDDTARGTFMQFLYDSADSGVHQIRLGTNPKIRHGGTVDTPTGQCGTGHYAWDRVHTNQVNHLMPTGLFRIAVAGIVVLPGVDTTIMPNTTEQKQSCDVDVSHIFTLDVASFVKADLRLSVLANGTIAANTIVQLRFFRNTVLITGSSTDFSINPNESKSIPCTWAQELSPTDDLEVRCLFAGAGGSTITFSQQSIAIFSTLTQAWDV